MSDYLVNLARRSAGLAPVVRARVGPAVPVDLDSSAETAREQRVSRGGAEGGEVVPRIVAPGALASDARSAASTISPAPMARVNSHAAVPVVQRAPATSAAPAAAPTPMLTRGAEAPVVAPRVAPGSAEQAAIIVPASAAMATATNVAHEDTPRDTHDEPRTIETRTETVIRPASADAAVPVVVTIEPAERAVAPVPPSRAEPAQERTVHVRIGAIEIHGADASSQQQAVAAAPAAAAPVAPVSSSSGFDDYAALRSYAPWAW